MNRFVRGCMFAVPISLALWAGIACVVVSCVGCNAPHGVEVTASLIDKDGAQWLRSQLETYIKERVTWKVDENHDLVRARLERIESAATRPVVDAAALRSSRENAAALRWQRAESACEWAASILAGLLAFIRIHRKLTPGTTATVSP